MNKYDEERRNLLKKCLERFELLKSDLEEYDYQVAHGGACAEFDWGDCWKGDIGMVIDNAKWLKWDADKIKEREENECLG